MGKWLSGGPGESLIRSERAFVSARVSLRIYDYRVITQVLKVNYLNFMSELCDTF